MTHILHKLMIIMLVMMPALASAADYHRWYFGDWMDTDKDCQTTKHEVLIRDAKAHVMELDNCTVHQGIWFDPYSGRTYDNVEDVEPDHIIPLRHAWGTGAEEWTYAERKALFNDPENLLIVSKAENRSKKHRGPDEWMPDDFAYWCEYIERWTTLKDKYELTYSADEKAVIFIVKKTCDRG